MTTLDPAIRSLGAGPARAMPGMVRTPAAPRSRPPSGPESPEPSAPVAVLSSGQRRYLHIKRGIDAVTAAAALLLLAPLLLLIALVVRLRLGAPVTFVQERTTRHGRIFRLRKFRTMHPVDPAAGRITDEQRLTRLGSVLRSTSLDELPSLWNILIGDMSLVGPRPLLPEYLPLYSPEQLVRQQVPAGLTGLGQVRGRNGLPWDARLELDRRYVMLLGPLTDLHILLRTAVTVLRREGVSETGHVTSTDFPGPLRTPRIRLTAGRARDEWFATTPTGEQIARCALRTDGPRAVRLDLERLPDACPPALLADELLPDVLRVLCSRARARGAELVRAAVPPTDSLLIELFTRLGFAPGRTALAGADGPAAAGASSDATARAAGDDPGRPAAQRGTEQCDPDRFRLELCISRSQPAQPTPHGGAQR